MYVHDCWFQKFRLVQLFLTYSPFAMTCYFILKCMNPTALVHWLLYSQSTCAFGAHNYFAMAWDRSKRPCVRIMCTHQPCVPITRGAHSRIQTNDLSCSIIVKTKNRVDHLKNQFHRICFGTRSKLFNFHKIFPIFLIFLKNWMTWIEGQNISDGVNLAWTPI